MSFPGIDVRGTTDRLVFRALLQDSAGVIVTTGTTTLKLYELQLDGTVKSYDFADNTFKSTALTTETLAMTHRTGNNGTTSTGVWTVALATLTGFTPGNIYLASVNNTGASPTIQVREFQFGNAEGDMVVNAGRLNVDATAVSTSTVAADRLEAALTVATGIDVNMGQLTPITPTADTTGEALRFSHQDLPDQVAAGANGGLPTVDANNRIAGIQGTLYNTLDQIGTQKLISTTATIDSTVSQIYLTAVPGTDADGDYNGQLLIIFDASDGNRPSAHVITGYQATSNICTITPTARFTPASGDPVQVWAVADSSVLAEVLKLSTGFGAASPETLNAYLKAMMVKTATVPSGLGTFNPATDALEVLRERIDLIEGAGFSTTTDSLMAIRDAIDTLVAPSIVTSTSVSGSGFISDCIGLVRRAVDEPSTQPKYTNADISEFIHSAFDVILADININTDHPILVRHNLTITAGKQSYTLPPTVATIWRVAKIHATTGLPEWELWPGSELSGHGHGFTLEGNTLRLLFDWQQTQTIQILYVPNSDVSFHKATVADSATDITATTIKFPATVADGALDTRKQAYAGYMLRLLSSTEGRIEERLITDYDNVTRIATIDEAWDTTPTGTVVYEVVPQFSRLLKHVVCLRAAIDVLAQEGNSKRMQTLTASYQVKMSALRRYLSQKQGRFPHSLSGDTMDNVNRGYWGGGYGGTDLL